jgi:hypothetical protein
MLGRMMDSLTRTFAHSEFAPQKRSVLNKAIRLLMGSFQSDPGIGIEMVKITGSDAAPLAAG